MSNEQLLIDRIRTALNGTSRAQYHELLRAVFPPDIYPNAWNYSANGGPPGCAMAFGRALRKMGAQSNGKLGSQKIIYFPDSNGRII